MVEVGALAALSLLLGGVGCVHTEPGASGGAAGWAVHTEQRPGFSYRVEYPAEWGVAEEGASTRFRAPAPLRRAVSVVVINEAETPPLPVDVTYTTVRLIEPEGRAIPVERRDPAAATERYVVRLPSGPYATEIRAILSPDDVPDEAYEAAFDHIVLTFSITPDPNR